MSHVVIDRVLRGRPQMSHWLTRQLLEARSSDVRAMLGELEQLKTILLMELEQGLYAVEVPAEIDFKKISI